MDPTESGTVRFRVEPFKCPFVQVTSTSIRFGPKMIHDAMEERHKTILCE